MPLSVFNKTKIWITIFTVLLFSYFSEGVIYTLNDTQYYEMPPVYHLDDYDLCVHQTNGTYCYVEMELVSDTPSELLQMITEYSEHTSTHFNHTQLRRGICLTKKCKHLLQENKVVDQKFILERCLNESLWRDFKLKTRLTNIFSCTKLDDPMLINTGDICAAVFFICLGLLNIIGSIYETIFIKGGAGNRFLLSFSFKRNFKKLIADNNTDPLQEKLKGLYGIKVLTTILVVFAHSLLPLVLNVENSRDVEQIYYSLFYQPVFNGTLIIQTFFVVTGCLMAYGFRGYFEKNNLTWVFIPVMIMMRWIRLTPAYAVVLIFTLTWIRFIASGPLWGVAIGVEVADCQRDGWWNMIYLNNYLDNSQCMAQTWFLAASMQLYILGVLVCFLARTPKSRSVILSALFIVGFIIPPLQTYLQDLDALVLFAPQTARNFLIVDRTFNHSYKRSHTNLPGFVLGLVVGNIIYDGLRDEKKMEKYKRLGVLYYLTFPMGLALLIPGVVFYQDRPRPSIYLRTVLSALFRPLFALLASIMFIGMAFKFENVYRRILEWRGWRIPARVSYSVFLIHVGIVRIFAGMDTTLTRWAFAQCMKEASAMIFMSFLIAYPFWLFVEAPLNQAVPIILGLSKMDKKDDVNQNMESKEKTMKQGTMSIESESKGSVVMDIRL